jgi:hypothetical protein
MSKGESKLDSRFRNFIHDYPAVAGILLAVCFSGIGLAVASLYSDGLSRQENANYLHLDCLGRTKMTDVGQIENWQPQIKYPVTNYLNAEVQMVPIENEKSVPALLFSYTEPEVRRMFKVFSSSSLSDGLEKRVFQGLSDFQNVLITGTLTNDVINLQGLCR